MSAFRTIPISARPIPYGVGWIAELQPLDWEGESTALVTGEAAMAAYETWLSSEKIAWE